MLVEALAARALGADGVLRAGATLRSFFGRGHGASLAACTGSGSMIGERAGARNRADEMR